MVGDEEIEVVMRRFGFKEGFVEVEDIVDRYARPDDTPRRLRIDGEDRVCEFKSAIPSIGVGGSGWWGEEFIDERVVGGVEQLR